MLGSLVPRSPRRGNFGAWGRRAAGVKSGTTVQYKTRVGPQGREQRSNVLEPLAHRIAYPSVHQRRAFVPVKQIYVPRREVLYQDEICATSGPICHIPSNLMCGQIYCGTFSYFQLHPKGYAIGNNVHIRYTAAVFVLNSGREPLLR